MTKYYMMKVSREGVQLYGDAKKTMAPTPFSKTET